MAQVDEATKQAFPEVVVWYNEYLQRLDLKMWPAANSSLPALLIGFEMGRPFRETQVERRRQRRQ